MTNWRDRHERFQAAFGPSWRSSVLGIGAIVLGILLVGTGGLLLVFEPTRTVGVALSGQGLALLASGIGLILMQEDKPAQQMQVTREQAHLANAQRIQELEQELRRVKTIPPEGGPSITPP